MTTTPTCELEGCKRPAFQMFFGVIVCLYHLNRGRKPLDFGTYQPTEGTK